ncbi:hypothetical protein EDB84DRAFT_1567010 [Lactarius hengduanensis]|nr:hypothetical protein EDB84DRAFT_1567010 [Lactarius hengduanensis]
MVAVSPPAKVLVTGVNGYLAVWIVKKYLEAGYSVRGTVRSLSKSAFLKEQFAEYGERLELVVVEDITKDGAFDDAVKGIDAIAHTASPFHYNAIDPDELIVPAVQGTTSILNSALKHGTGYDETSWNNAAVAAVASKGSAAGPVTIYLASKTLAERAAWEFVAAHKAELAWDLVVINPPLIFGPSLSPAQTIDEINTSQREIYETLTGARTGAQLRGQGNWVHVSVAADAHVRATYSSAAGGERIIVRSGYFFYQDILDAAAELGIPNVPHGEPYSTGNIPKTKILATTKAEDLLGMKVTVPLKDVIEESVKDFKARGYPGTATVSSIALYWLSHNLQHHFESKTPVKPYVLDDNDNRSEVSRLNIQYLYFKRMFDYPKIAPPVVNVAHVRRVIDVGTGTGAWALDFMSQPEVRSRGVQVFACDISAAKFPQADGSGVGKITFFQQDVTKPFPDDMLGTFDLVHMTCMCWALTVQGWKSALQNLRDLLS